MSIYDEVTQAIPLDQLAAELGVSPDEAQQAVNAVLPALVGGLGANASDPAGAGSLLDALSQHDGSLYSGGVDLSQVDTSEGAAISGHIFGDSQGAVVDQLGQMQLSGGSSLGGSLVRKLLPILAPIVLSYLAKKLQEKMSGASASSGGAAGPGDSGTSTAGGSDGAAGSVLPGSSGPSGSSGDGSATGGGPGSLQDMLNEVLGGAAGSAGGSGPSAGSDTTPSTPSSAQAPSGGLDAGSIINILGGLLGGGSR